MAETDQKTEAGSATPAKDSRQPVIDPDTDAFGEPYGRCETPHFRRAAYLAACQGVSSVGNRPQDWAKRTLLVHQSGDDGRNWAYRKVLKNTSGFLVQRYDQFDPKRKDRETVRQSRAFDYLNRMHQLRMLDHVSQGTPEFRALAGACICPTSLYKTKDFIPVVWSSARRSRVCLAAWNCPHCYARLAAKNLINLQERLHAQPIGFMALISDGFPLLMKAADRFGDLRIKATKQITRIAESIGGEYGSVAFQVGPLREQKIEWKSNEVSYPMVEKLWVRIAVTAFIPGDKEHAMMLRSFKDSYPNLKLKRGADFHVDIHAFDSRRTVRTMMFGHPRNGKPACPLMHNTHGLFYWPLLGLCSPEQWSVRFRMTQKQQAVRSWGNWPSVQLSNSASGPVSHGVSPTALSSPKNSSVSSLKKLKITT
jgi:hypothetical protein